MFGLALGPHYQTLTMAAFCAFNIVLLLAFKPYNHRYCMVSCAECEVVGHSPVVSQLSTHRHPTLTSLCQPPSLLHCFADTHHRQQHRVQLFAFTCIFVMCFAALSFIPSYDGKVPPEQYKIAMGAAVGLGHEIFLCATSCRCRAYNTYNNRSEQR